MSARWFRSPLVWTLGLCWVACTSGCSGRRADYSQLGLIEVTGTVTLDGSPLPQAALIFEADDRTFSQAVTDAAGRYRLRYNSEQTGVTRGWKTVRISTVPGRFSDAGEASSAPAGAAATGERLPARYNGRSELKVVVEPHTHNFDFALESRP